MNSTAFSRDLFPSSVDREWNRTQWGLGSPATHRRSFQGGVHIVQNKRLAGQTNVQRHTLREDKSFPVICYCLARGQ
ncbi:hypothetical protein MHYP_G00196320 [Metynnis hypsauchen]